MLTNAFNIFEGVVRVVGVGALSSRVVRGSSTAGVSGAAFVSRVDGFDVVVVFVGFSGLFLIGSRGIISIFGTVATTCSTGRTRMDVAGSVSG